MIDPQTHRAPRRDGASLAPDRPPGWAAFLATALEDSGAQNRAQATAVERPESRRAD
jgi:hypothetical protein